VYRAQKNIPFQWMVVSFGIFILSCGATHFMSVLTVWHPFYWLEGDVKLLTAVASVATAATLPLLIPKVLLLVDSAKKAEERQLKLEAANQDLTTLRRRDAETAANKLREKEQKLMLALEASGIGMWSWDLRTNAVEADSQVRRHLGVGLAETINSGFLGRTLHPDDQARLTSLFQRTMRTAEDYEADFRVVWPNQKVRWVSARGRVFRDPDGRPRQVLGVTTDITERKNSEQAIRENEARFRQLADTMPQMVWTATAEGKPEYFNRRWHDSGEVANGAKLDETWIQCLHPDDVPFTLNKWQSSLREQRPFEVEYRFKENRTGGYRWHLGRALPVTDPDGKVVRWLGTSTDIHDQKMAEKEIRVLNAELEKRVRERTSELEKANEHLEEFSYSVSHDLRSPLRAMQGMAQAVWEDYGARLDDQGRYFLKRIVLAASRMDQLIHDLLDYSRLTRAKLKPEPVNLRDAVDEALDQLETSIDESKAVVQIEPSLPDVYAHRPLLVQALSNLVSNAVKYVAPGVRPEISIRATQTPNGARLWIEDNGIGIDPSHHEQIFRVFERLHNTDAYSGTGVGLAIVHKGIQRMGGKVGVESALGHGSKFWIELPTPAKVARPEEVRQG
jgi:PAS domain S-box-containing protein